MKRYSWHIVVNFLVVGFVAGLLLGRLQGAHGNSAADLHCISGTITHDDGSPFPGVTLRFVGTLPNGQRYNLITGTDGKGYYEGLVPTGWSGTVTPSYDDLPLRPAEFVQR